MAYERLSLHNASMIASYAEHIQRYEFALQYCRGMRVLDAGCGTGYGSYFLATNGAKTVLGVDISDEALNEAKHNYEAGNLSYERRDVELLADDASLAQKFDVIVNFENLEHLRHPAKLVSGAAKLLGKGGRFITSTPNGAISTLDARGQPMNPFHFKEFTLEELTSLLAPYFRVSIYGQWLTHQGMLRQLRSRELFEQLCEAYYNPFSRLGRVVKKVLGKQTAQPPLYTGNADAFSGDYAIHPLETKPYRWEPTTLVAICER